MLRTSSGQPIGARPPSPNTTSSGRGEEGHNTTDDGAAAAGGTPRTSTGASSVAPPASSEVVVVAGPNHWSGQVVEVVVSVGSEGGITVLGGSDNGEFPYLGEINQGIRYQKGDPPLVSAAILLEVQGQRVAGYTQRDVVAWINHCTRNGNPCVIRTAPPGTFELNYFSM